jgi:hypothetical protein
MYRIGLNNPPRICLTSRKSRVNIYDATNRQTVNVKWRVLEFTELLSSALKYCGLPRQAMALPWQTALSSGLRIAKFRAQVAWMWSGQANGNPLSN